MTPTIADSLSRSARVQRPSATLPPLTSPFQVAIGSLDSVGDRVDRADLDALAAGRAPGGVDNGVARGRADRTLRAGEDARAAALAGSDGQHRHVHW